MEPKDVFPCLFLRSIEPLHLNNLVQVIKLRTYGGCEETILK